jgi:pimeloyl-ACP methyl ester carboxylesterase
MVLPHVVHRFVNISGVRVFYRETGSSRATPLVLLHGFPSASHQFRRLFEGLGTRFRLIAPDYPVLGTVTPPRQPRRAAPFCTRSTGSQR